MATCKECRFFIQGEGRGGVCEKKPYMLTRQGRVHMINGKPIPRYIQWSRIACNMFEKGGAEG